MGVGERGEKSKTIYHDTYMGDKMGLKERKRKYHTKYYDKAKRYGTIYTKFTTLSLTYFRCLMNIHGLQLLSSFPDQNANDFHEWPTTRIYLSIQRIYFLLFTNFNFNFSLRLTSISFLIQRFYVTWDGRVCTGPAVRLGQLSVLLSLHHIIRYLLFSGMVCVLQVLAGRERRIILMGGLHLCLHFYEVGWLKRFYALFPTRDWIGLERGGDLFFLWDWMDWIVWGSSVLVNFERDGE